MTIKDTMENGKISVDFCDLCNESVPRSDIDAGHATQIKGRVVCATCNKAMSVAREAARAENGAAAQSVQVATHLGGHAHAHTSHAPRSSSSGAWIGVLALLGAAGVGWWSWGELQRRGREEAKWRSELSTRLASERSAFDEQMRARQADVERLSGALDAANAQSAQELDGRLKELLRAQTDLAERVGALATQTEGLPAGLDTLQRHDRELLTLQERYDSLDLELDKIVEQFDQALHELQESRVAAPPPEAPVEQKPAWFGLTQNLTHESANERWKAVVALAETKDPASAPYIVPVLGDVDQFLRYYAARTLGELGNPVAIGALIDALGDAEDVVREEAYASLKLLSKRDFPFDPRAGDASERQKRIKVWREWWDKERPKGSV